MEDNEKFVVMVKDERGWDCISDYMEYAQAQQYKWKAMRQLKNMAESVALLDRENFQKWENGEDPDFYRKQKVPN